MSTARGMSVREMRKFCFWCRIAPDRTGRLDGFFGIRKRKYRYFAFTGNFLQKLKFADEQAKFFPGSRFVEMRAVRDGRWFDFSRAPHVTGQRYTFLAVPKKFGWKFDARLRGR